ncbi:MULTISPECIES: acyl-CoA thioesterase [Limibacillus]|uniref:Acyl-CoA thioesterase YciA n=1 Tax=Limibacillus halophilus TaxID=1579333 RepID=A0A839STK8_9PROT|nr:acyl-CoA thioesterase [Limibacillus halophilus]MBB3065822.1 acyl-CoA thioesterase YciA [Limibacillus halophilus]
MDEEIRPPDREPALRTLAMPGDANPNGDIFGGWVLAQMDLAGAVPAVKRARGRVATVAIDAMRFHRPIFVGDLVSCYATILAEGATSMQVRVETWVERSAGDEIMKVTEGMFVYVAIDADGGKRPLPVRE